MRKRFGLSVLLLLLSFSAYALPLHECMTGAWIDDSKPGEGILLQVGEDNITGLFYNLNVTPFAQLAIAGGQEQPLTISGEGQTGVAVVTFVAYNDIVFEYSFPAITKHYVIPVGTYYTGTFDRMFFILDNDKDLVSDSIYSNISVSEQSTTIDFGVYDTETPMDLSIAPYGVSDSQDKEGLVTIEDGGRTLRLRGNVWKRIAFPVEITPDTVLEFDFTSNKQGDVHAIGFDNDDNTSPEYTFSLYGTQEWAIEDFENYDPECGRVGCREVYNYRPAIEAIDCPPQVSGVYLAVPDPLK